MMILLTYIGKFYRKYVAINLCEMHVLDFTSYYIKAMVDV